MVNEVRLIGNIGQIPELFTSESGVRIAKISLATNSDYKNDKGEKVKSVDWHNVVVFGNRAEALVKYTNKGAKIAVTGRLKTRTYDDKQ